MGSLVSVSVKDARANVSVIPPAFEIPALAKDVAQPEAYGIVAHTDESEAKIAVATKTPIPEVVLTPATKFSVTV